MKAKLKAHDEADKPLAGKTLAMIFERPSTRTRVSFDVGMRQLGGESIMLTGAEMQLGRGETIADTARVLSRYVDAIMIRILNHDALLELAAHATVPVINGLTRRSHPCQVMADLMTFEEHRGPIAGQVVAWCGDGNNVARSWIEAAVRFGFTLRLATPDALRPPPELVDWARAQGGRIELTDDPGGSVRSQIVILSDLPWIDARPGVRQKRIWEDKATERRALLARFEPGATLPPHRHVGDELIFLLEGANADESGIVATGNLNYRPNGCVHSVTTQHGATVFAVVWGRTEPV